MGNNTQHHPLVDLPRDKPINLHKLVPKNEWWTLWYYILTGKMIRVTEETN
jgi:hypothetical protein